MHYFAQLETAAAELLKAPLKAIGVPTVEPYAGQLSDAAQLKNNIKRLPAVWVLSGDLNITTVNQSQELDLELVVLVAAQSVKGSTTAAHGGSRTGAYDILDVVRQTLNGKPVLEPWSPAVCFFEGAVFSAPDLGMIIYSVNYNLKNKVRGYY